MSSCDVKIHLWTVSEQTVAAGSVSAPLFAMNSRFDAANRVSPATDANYNAHGAFQLDVLRRTVFSDPKNGGFITSCHEHCVSGTVDTPLVQRF
eukprot:COSAG04_NODE_8761_length_933_cov_1.569544_1_plen_93_part_10